MSVIKLEGDLNVVTINAVMKDVYKKLKALDGGSSATLDCSGLKKVDSASIALLVECLRTAKKHNINLSIENIPTKMQKIIELSNLKSIFE